MKKLILAASIISSLFVQPKAEASFRYETLQVCSGALPSKDGHGDIVTVRVLTDKMRWDALRTKIIVHLNEQGIFEKPVVQTKESGADFEYVTRTFDNANNAPSTLRLRIYLTDHGLIGHFQEESFLPELQGSTLSCANL